MRPLNVIPTERSGVEKPASSLSIVTTSGKQQVSPLRDDKAVAPVEMTP